MYTVSDTTRIFNEYLTLQIRNAVFFLYILDKSNYILDNSK
jgi:hypothetical protein